MANFILGFHCHQPIGNFDSVFKSLHEKSYSPLIKVLTKFHVKFCFHASGALFEWWGKNDPEFIRLIADGVESGEIELIGGGYYEPILAMIPQKDRITQLEMMNKTLKRFFGKYPGGAWITERIWQPDIIKDLKEAGLNFAFLDDFQFFQAGVSENTVDNIFRTEYNGEYLDVFPIHERLRYKLPFAEPGESLNEILYFNGRHSNISVMFDDGEKMGGWPDTYEWVYGRDGKKGWLEDFINLANSAAGFSRINFILPSDILKTESVRIPVYLPISSYREMGEWTLPPEKRRSYESIKARNSNAPLSGGIWHNFLTRYPEANLLHKRMVNLSYKMNCAAKANGGYPEEALNELLKSQANDAYWHGVFGGIYLPHLRRAVHKAFITAYRLYMDGLGKGSEKDYYDFDMDGEKEIFFYGNCWLAVYKPSAGSFIALDYAGKDLFHSLGDVFCLHSEYDILKLKENAFKVTADNGNTDNGNPRPKDGGNNAEIPPETIHRDVKYPSDLSEKDLKIYPDLLPAFEILFNEKRISFKNEVVKEDPDKKSVFLETSGFLKEDSEPAAFNGVEALADLKIKIGEALEFSVNYKPQACGNLNIIFRFAFPAGDGPASNIDIGGDVKGLNSYIEKEFCAGADNFIYLTDSFWGGKVILKERTECDYLKKYGMLIKPITTISLSESGYERIFQGVELKYNFNLTPEGGFSSIIILDIEKISV